MDRVAFISAEDGDDLIVSFALVADEPTEVLSITLIRTPKYEVILDEAERGVSLSDERSGDETPEMLRQLRFEASMAAIKTDRGDYKVDLSAVDRDELVVASRILKKMNFDDRFLLSPMPRMTVAWRCRRYGG